MKIKKNDFKLLGVALAFLAVISGIIYLIINIDNFKTYTFDQEIIKRESYAPNEVIPVYIDEEELVKSYYSEFINLLMDNPEEAYKLIKKEIKNENYPTFESFMQKIDEMISNGLFENRVREYRKDKYEDKTLYYITDTSGNTITIVETSIMDYEVII